MRFMRLVEGKKIHIIKSESDVYGAEERPVSHCGLQGIEANYFGEIRGNSHICKRCANIVIRQQSDY